MYVNPTGGDFFLVICLDEVFKAMMTHMAVLQSRIVLVQSWVKLGFIFKIDFFENVFLLLMVQVENVSLLCVFLLHSSYTLATVFERSGLSKWFPQSATARQICKPHARVVLANKLCVEQCHFHQVSGFLCVNANVHFVANFHGYIYVCVYKIFDWILWETQRELTRRWRVMLYVVSRTPNTNQNSFQTNVYGL